MRNILSLVLLSVREPRAGLREVLDAPLGNGGRQSLFALAAILPTLLIFGVLSTADAWQDFAIGPMTLLGLQALALTLMAGLAFAVGRWRGGKGSFSDCVLALSWLQITMVVAQVACVVVELALPFLGAIIGIAALALMMWLATNFIAEVHGFSNVAMVFLSIILTLFLTSFVLAFVTSLAGVGNV